MRLPMKLCSLFLFLFSFASSLAFADYLVIEGKSKDKRELGLKFDGLKITKESKTALLCAEPAGVVVEAAIYMPTHGHGSTPMKFAESEKEGCTDLSKINFVMLGPWELRLKFEDGDTAALKFEVVK